MVNIVFIHPDLGIGGAERAVVDAALALKSQGHVVSMVTAHHDPNHCFEETKDGRLEVTAVGDWLPRSFLGRFQALFAYLRMIYAAIYLAFFSGLNYELIFCDQISACIPFLRLGRKCKILFYCHFPDMLLTQRPNLLKRLYRTPIDWLEEKTTGMADCVLVNSHFTAGVFKETFKSLQHVDTEVVNPIPAEMSCTSAATGVEPINHLLPPNTKTLFVSINRYERKKNLKLAIQALDKLRTSRGGGDSALDGVCLVVAGGYDERVDENRQHYLELTALVDRLELKPYVVFLRSISSAVKQSLLAGATCLVYTPDREHFGIVPVEAMYAGRPVIAVDSGGPKETVANGETGFLCPPGDVDSFAAAMKKIADDPQLAKQLGERSRERAKTLFSFETFTQKLNNVVSKLTGDDKNK